MLNDWYLCSAVRSFLFVLVKNSKLSFENAAMQRPNEYFTDSGLWRGLLVSFLLHQCLLTQSLDINCWICAELSGCSICQAVWVCVTH